MQARKVVSLMERSQTWSAREIQERIDYHLKYTLAQGIKGKNYERPAKKDFFEALSLTVRDIVIDHWNYTEDRKCHSDSRQCHYFSLEFLQGRMLGNNMINMGVLGPVAEVIQLNGYSLNEIEEMEADAGIGNGGLGRLAACYMASSATTRLPVTGYGILYHMGFFLQALLGGRQFEKPDHWISSHYPWLIEDRSAAVNVRFWGQMVQDPHYGEDRRRPVRIEGYEAVRAVPFDMPVIGYRRQHHVPVNRLRLWSATDPVLEKFSYEEFNRGRYDLAYAQVINPHMLSVTTQLYPNDKHFEGQILRLKQQFFLVSASLQDIFRQFEKKYGSDYRQIAEKNVFQINDTHPALLIPELMRILVDEKKIDWDQAWQITRNSVNYTNHTVLPEALECWPAEVLRMLLPRQMNIIELINLDFCDQVRARFDNDEERVQRMSIIDNGVVRMANLAVVGSRKVNGVAEIHSSILRESMFRDFYEMFPEKFDNVTNGVDPRRWIFHANPELAGMITGLLGSEDWLTDLSQLRNLERFANDEKVLERLVDIKMKAKAELALYLHEHNPVKDADGSIKYRVDIDPESIISIQAKRLHEYKRQLMTAAMILLQYIDLKSNPDKVIPKQTFVFAAKAAPGYYMAKQIIAFINVLADIINHDPDVKGLLKIAFVEDYNVSRAEILIPAADLSIQVSTAGKEASGTGNMKFALNGGLTIGTMDGATIEMAEEIGKENMFIFGLGKDEVPQVMSNRDIHALCGRNPELRRLIDVLMEPPFVISRESRELFREIGNYLVAYDPYLVLEDLLSYREAHERACRLYMQDHKEWARRMLLNIARSGKFSSDRSILEYNERMWGLEPIRL